MMSQEERMVEIESKIAHQEHAHEQLNEVVYDQQKQIEALRKQLVQLKQRLEDRDNQEPIEDAPPPHY